MIHASTKWTTIAGVVVVGAVVVAVLATQPKDSEVTSAPKAKTTLVAIEKRDLATTSDVSGTLGFGEVSTIAFKNPQGTITALPEVGTVVNRGEALAEIDGEPTPFLMAGPRPAWRNFTSAMTDGPDVKQLEANLVALGMSDITPDEDFTSETTTAIKAWQDKIGATVDGVLASSEIVFAPGAVRISGHQASVGDAANGPAILVTGTRQVVSVSLDTSKAALAIADSPVSVDLADGSTVTGKITFVASTATTSSGQGQNATSTTSLAVTVTLDQPVDSGDKTPVIVKLSSNTAIGVMAVPVKSLVALVEGGYALQVSRDGVEQLVAVTPGVFSGGWVEVSGKVAIGDKVVVPE